MELMDDYTDKTWKYHLRIVVPGGGMDAVVVGVLKRNKINFIGSLDPVAGYYSAYECDIRADQLRELLAKAPEYNGSLKFDQLTGLIA